MKTQQTFTIALLALLACGGCANAYRGQSSLVLYADTVIIEAGQDMRDGGSLSAQASMSERAAKAAAGVPSVDKGILDAIKARAAKTQEVAP